MENTLGSGRARVDPSRRQGNANDVAKCGAVESVSVISARQLETWSNIAAQSPRLAMEAHREAQAERSARSKARCEAWPNTIDALRVQGEQAREAARNADEARRVAIDEEEARLRETKRQQVVQAANVRLMQSDERGIQVRKALQLHNALQGQEEQRRRKAEMKSLDSQELAEYAAHVRAGAVAEKEEKQAAIERNRQAILATKAAQLEFLEAQLADRRHARESDVFERQLIRTGAEEEELRNATKKLETKYKSVQLKQEQLDQVLSSPRTPREKLQARIEEAARVKEEDDRAAAEREAKQRQLEEIAQQRHKYHASLIENATGALQQLNATTSPRDRAAANFSESPSFVSKMLADNLQREATHKQHKRELGSSFASGTAIPPSPRRGSPMDLSSPAYRERLDHQIDMLDKFDAELAAQKRQDLEQLRYIQRLQAQEKKTQASKEVEELRLEVEVRKKAQQEDDELFRNFVEQQMPKVVSPRVQKMATKVPYGHSH